MHADALDALLAPSSESSSVFIHHIGDANKMVESKSRPPVLAAEPGETAPMPEIEHGVTVLFTDTGYVLESRRASVKLIDGHVAEHREIIEVFRAGQSIWRRA